jgi:hypothetical protein
MKKRCPEMKVYFAHPCFNEKQQDFKRAFLEKIKTACSHAELTSVVIVDPFDHIYGRL